LYRIELSLDIKQSAMAVIIQELIFGEKSGIAFSVDPVNRADRIIIEAIYGLNQALVDGSLEPDRWVIDKSTNNVIEYVSATKNKHLVPTTTGVKYEPLSPAFQEKPVLNENQITELVDIVKKLEDVFKIPQDSEWTIRENLLTLLQSRPITTVNKDESGYFKEDKRQWYLSLFRSMEELNELRSKIENHYFPEMDNEYQKLQSINLDNLSDSQLATEIERRFKIFKKWESIYWKEFIPLAHGFNCVTNQDSPLFKVE